MSAVGANTIQVCRLYNDGWHIETTTPYGGNEAWNYGIPYDQAHEYVGQPCAGTPATLPAAGASDFVWFIIVIGVVIAIAFGGKTNV